MKNFFLGSRLFVFVDRKLEEGIAVGRPPMRGRVEVWFQWI